MKNRILATIILTIFLTISCKQKQEPRQIDITEDMVINESGTGTAYQWFDEQTTDSLPVSRWKTRGEESFWPASVVVDLKGDYSITSIKIFDGEPSDFDGKSYRSEKGKLEIAVGNPFEWEHLSTYDLKNDNQWHTIPINSNSKFLQLTKRSTQEISGGDQKKYHCDLVINEVKVFGVQKNSSQQKIINNNTLKAPIRKYTFDEYMGANAYKWTDNKLLAPVVGTVREYSHWFQNGVTNEKDTIAWVNIPKYGSFDKYYKTAAEEYHLDVIPDVHRHVDIELGENKPDFGKDPLDPFSYKMIADYMFQMAARYGNTKVADSLLHIKAGEPALTGAGWVKYYETWNEPERWWGNPDDHFSPYEYAALASAAYDGHQGKMGLTYGIKQADPKSVHIMAGISSLEFDFPRAVKFWSDYYRNGSLPFDVLNFHHYNNSSGFQHANSNTRGISPEADHFKERLEKVIQQRDQYFPGLEVWLTEFGWDTDKKSIQSATGHKLYPEKISFFELQGIWMVRAYLAGAAAGIDRMYMYMADDIEDPGLFHNSGLLTIDGKRKPSWYYTATLKNCLTGTRFVKEVETDNKDVLCYEFKNNDKLVYAIWCPTSDGTIVKDFPLKIGNKSIHTEIEITRLSDKHQKGRKEKIKQKDIQLLLDITEKPIFVTIR